MSKVTDKLTNAKRIYTNELRQYKYLISPEIHRTTHRGTNHIERNNLTIHTHIKRLTRRTICFSRKAIMFYAILKIYFWGGPEHSILLIFYKYPQQHGRISAAVPILRT